MNRNEYMMKNSGLRQFARNHLILMLALPWPAILGSVLAVFFYAGTHALWWTGLILLGFPLWAVLPIWADYAMGDWLGVEVVFD